MFLNSEGKREVNFLIMVALKVCSVKMAGYWPHSSFCILCIYGRQLRLGPYMKNDFANIHPS